MKTAKHIDGEVVLPYSPKSIDETNPNRGFVIAFLYFDNPVYAEQLVVKGRSDLVDGFILTNFSNRKYLQITTLWNGGKCRGEILSVHHPASSLVNCYIHKVRYPHYDRYYKDPEDELIPVNLRKRTVYRLKIYKKTLFDGKTTERIVLHRRKLPKRWIPEFDGLVK